MDKDKDTLKHRYRQDPSHTLTLRNRFASEMSGRFNKLKALIRKAVVELDVLGLKKPTGSLAINANMTTPDYRQFAFKTSGDKVDSFMKWLQAQEKAGILNVKIDRGEEVGDFGWGQMYIESAYKRGIQTAYNEMENNQGIKMEGLPEVEGAFFAPIHADKVGLLATRTYEELKGITNAMSQQIARTLSQAMVDGKGAMATARMIMDRVDKIGRTRARMLARTEMMRAHHVATINTYNMAGVAGVKVIAEWSTAGDELVCDLCEPMEGKTFTLEQAMDMLPRHPNCRCVMIPADVEAEYETMPDEEVIPVDEVAFPDNENMNKALAGQLTEEQFYQAYNNDPEFTQRMRAMACYTNGNVATCRDPSLFKEGYAAEVSGRYTPAKRDENDIMAKLGLGRQSTFSFNPTKADYEYANKYLLSLTNGENRKKGVVWRGMEISPDDPRGKSFLADLKPGSTIELNPIDSLTRDRDIAEQFAEWDDGGEEYHVMYKISGSTKGVDISSVSHFAGEEEVLCSGKYKVIKIQDVSEMSVSYDGPHMSHRLIVHLEEVSETGIGVKKADKVADKVADKAEAKAKAAADKAEAKAKAAAEKVKAEAEARAKEKAEADKKAAEMEEWMKKMAAEKAAKEKAEPEARAKAEKEAARKQAELSAKIAKDIAAAEKAKAAKDPAKADRAGMTLIEKKRAEEKRQYKIPDKLDYDALALRIDEMGSMKEMEALFKELHISDSITVLPNEMGFQDPGKASLTKNAAKVIVKQHAHMMNSSEYMKHMAYSETRLQRVNSLGLSTRPNIVGVHNELLRNQRERESIMLDDSRNGRWSRASGVCTQSGTKKYVSVRGYVRNWNAPDVDEKAKYGKWIIGETPGGIYTHETGHAWERNIRLDMPVAEKRKLDAAIDAIVTSRDEIVLTEYAMTDRGEAFAEIFATAIHKDYQVKPVPGHSPEKVAVRKGVEALRQFLEII